MQGWSRFRVATRNLARRPVASGPSWIRPILATSLAVVIGLSLTIGSTMGFKLVRTLSGPGGTSQTGQHSVCLPWVLKPGITDAVTLRQDMGSSVASVSRFLRATNASSTYPPANNFALVAGEGYRIVVTTGMTYKILGSHDPGLVVTFHGPDGGITSASGQNDYCPPYHATSTTASALRNEIGSIAIATVSRFNTSNNLMTTYPPTDFSLAAGESYRVVAITTVQFQPSHY